MEWLTALNKTLDYVEQHLHEKISMRDCADVACVSEFYLQKGFQIITGFSLGEYIRNRRLYCAACEIANTDKKVIDVALDFGYDTAESFTKAFSRFHNATPSQIKNDSKRIKMFLPLKISIQVTGGNKMDYVVSPIFGFKVIGFERVFSFENAYDEIPKFWDEICQKYWKNIYAGNPLESPEEKAIMANCICEYGVCIDDVGNGKFRYMIAGKYCGGEVPETMTLFDVPAGDWAKFKSVGAMPNALQNLNTRIFKEWLPGNSEYEMNGICNIEWYSCDGNTTDDNYESAIWIPVKRKTNV